MKYISSCWRQADAILRVSFRRVSQNHKNAAAIKLEEGMNCMPIHYERGMG